MVDARQKSRQVRRAESRKKQPERPPPFRWARLIAPLLVAAGILAYVNSLRGEFVMDDRTAILQNPTIRSLWPPGSVLSPPVKSPVTGRPLVNLSLAINYALGGLDVTSYHVFNLAFHVLSALVLFGIVRRAFLSPALGDRWRARSTGIAAAVSLLWVVHPLTSETVDYTIQRTELLMGFFFLLTFYAAIRSFEKPEQWPWLVAAVSSFALGLGCKEVIVVAPLVLLVFDRLFWSTSVADALRRHRALYLGLAAVLFFFVLVVGTRLRHALTGLGRRMSPWDYALTQQGVIVHYLRLAIWPHPLVADYGGWPVVSSIKAVLPSLVVVAALVGLTVWGLVRRNPLAFLGVWFFAILAPTSSIRPIAVEIAAERRMYLPLAAVLVLVVLGIGALIRWLQAPRAVGWVVVAALALTLTLVTLRRNADYRTTLSFWSDVVAKRPDNARAHMWLGNHLRSQGRTAEAMQHLSKAVQIQPRNSNAQNGLGALLASQGRREEAISRYREAIRLDSDNAPAHKNLASILVLKGDLDEATVHYREAVRIDPEDPSAHYNLARALVRQGLTIEAIEHFETPLRLPPDFPGAEGALEDVRRSLQP